MAINKEIKDNEDIIDVAWVSIDEEEKWDDFTLPILKMYENIYSK